MKRIFLTGLMVMKIFFSCSQKTILSVDKSIVGKWQWVNSVGGFTGHDTLKPEPNTTVILTLNPDNTYKRTLNGQAIADGSYDIIEVQSIYDKSKRRAIRFDNFNTNNGLIINLEEPNLTLSDNHVEPYVHLYKRLN